MILTKRIQVKSNGHTDIIDITEKVKEAIDDSGMTKGLASVFVSGSTASVSTIEFEPNLIKDMKAALEKIAAYGKDYEHHKTWGDDNGPAHIRATLMGPGISVPFENKSLLIGTWQQVVVLDFDTRKRNREVIIQLVGE